ncbi:MAG: hypothetical protein K0R36_2318 [Chryseobacterium sp.]|jgi:glycosyltransferase involved in cell wall biosynthesis|uniref:glycosyltransferase n=1 Tax=Chryseobacterium sp. TaxID=1871047 RepID=UPI0026120999|nr:glycosyltransferase [Chryseobacterium sp.]MDF2552977.1 hypothetical protein [Chryseobacterium sp.]MDF2932987.1 hypothetical protein [Chryseobacterium sp.]
MKISGYGYVRNGFQYGVPFLESIQSVLPVCDEFIAVVGDSTDGTREAIENLNSPKIRIVDTIWDDNLKQHGKIFAQQSNIGLEHVTGDWVFHIQADEVIHENDLPKILENIKKYNDNPVVEGFLQPFLHFWGDYNHIRNSRAVHKNEIRIFKNNPEIRSYIDSQGFRKFKSNEGYLNGSERGEKLKVLRLDAPIYHYNSVRSRKKMMLKANNFEYYYGHKDEKLVETPKEEYNYHTVDRVGKFLGTHPKVMTQAIANHDFVFEHDKSQAVWDKKDKLVQPLEDLLKIRIGEYKNYILLKNIK